MNRIRFMRLLSPILLLLMMSTTTLAATVIDQAAVGKTFQIPGPNCFSTALRVTGLQPTFRGIDMNEFEGFIKNFCHPVEHPESGDIGTYAILDYEFLHAFVFVNAEMGIEKAGADYDGKSAVMENSLVNIDWTRFASPECRRYSPDIRLCSNIKQFYHCEKPVFPKEPELDAHNANIAKFEGAMARLIEESLSTSEQLIIYKDLQLQLLELHKEFPQILNLKLEPHMKFYLAERVRSINKQMKFVDTHFSLLQAN